MINAQALVPRKKTVRARRFMPSRHARVLIVSESRRSKATEGRKVM